jgi:hypothetical protein
MKKIFTLSLSVFLIFKIGVCQTEGYHGKPIAEIFSDFHLNLNDTLQKSGFAINRAYLGYKFMPDDHFSGTIIVNIGSPDELSSGSQPRRYAFFREASLSYTDEKLSVYLGITGTRLFDFQQKFWGKRYIANTYQSINGYGYVADLGVVIDYKFSDEIKADVSLMNGEGYSNIQLDNSLKASMGFTFTSQGGAAARIYEDLIKVHGLWQNTFLVFVGIKKEYGFFGAEFTHKTNLDVEAGHNAYGFSATSGLSLTHSVELFARYDYSTSSKTSEEEIPWNYHLDGKFLITGIQKTFSSNVKVALDYQGHFPYSTENQRSSLIFINALFSF